MNYTGSYSHHIGDMQVVEFCAALYPTEGVLERPQ